MSKKKASETFMFRLNEYKQKALIPQDVKGSTGTAGRLIEILDRHLIMVNGIIRVSDIRARLNSKPDCKTKRFGVTEIKSGSGAVCYAEGLETFGIEDLTENNILKNANTIAWCPFPQFVVNELMEKDILEMSEDEFLRVLKAVAKSTLFFENRELFIECLKAMGKDGLKSSLKISKQPARTESEKKAGIKKRGKQINIQTISNKMAEKMYNFIEENEVGTLDNYITFEK